MGIEIVLHNGNANGFWTKIIHQRFEQVSLINPCPLLSDFDMAPTRNGFTQHEQIGGAIALILIINPLRLPRLSWDGNPRFFD